MSSSLLFDARMKTPFTCVLAGSPLSGKTSFVRTLLQQRWKFIDHKIDYLVWFYGQTNSFVDSLRNQVLGIPTTVVYQLPDTGFEQFIQRDKRGLIVIDDLMQTAGESKQVTDLFCNKVQHLNVSVILLMQNLFYHGKERTTLLRCAHYLVVFKNPLDASVPMHLSQRLMPLQRKLFVRMFEHATKPAYGYLYIDGRQTTPDAARFRTNIFDPNGVQHGYNLSSSGDDDVVKQQQI